MKMEEAMELIHKHREKINEPPGFMVSFEKRENGMLCGGYFPEKHEGEVLIETKEEAWQLAEEFNNATGDEYVNIYVVNQDFRPVSKDKEFNSYRNRR